MKRRTVWIAVLLLLLILPGFRKGLTVRQYTVETDKVISSVRFALITDLHSCDYGEGMQTLVQAIDAGQPDLILLCGDIFDDVLPDGNTITLLEAIGTRYPCYYVTGNHEYWAGDAAFREKMDALVRSGVTWLDDSSEQINVRDASVLLCGINDPAKKPHADAQEDQEKGFFEQLEQVAEGVSEKEFSILLSHRPEFLDEYSRYGFDLAVCGHAHGGQWRIPGILNGLFAPDQGFFPSLAGGRYEKDATVMIVSRGLSRESTRVSRFYNPPELVFVDIQPKNGRAIQ